MSTSTDTTLAPSTIMSRRGGHAFNLKMSFDIPVKTSQLQSSAPNLTNLPRRTKSVKRKVVASSAQKPVESTIASTPTLSSPSSRPSKTPIITRCLQEIVPGLFTAFSAQDLFPDAPSNYSHYVHVVESSSSAGKVTYNSNSSSQSLILSVLPNIPDDGRTRLSVEQLSAARDFLAGAMPRPLSEYNSRYPPYTASSSTPSLLDFTSSTSDSSDSSLPTTPTEPRMLITCPRSSPVDAMSIAACFLASTSGESVHDVIMRFNDCVSSSVVNNAAQRTIATQVVLAETQEKLAQEASAELQNTLILVEDALHLKEESELSVHERRRLRRERELQLEEEALGNTIGPKRGLGLVGAKLPRAKTGLGISGLKDVFEEEDDPDAWRGCVSVDGMEFIEDIARGSG